MSTGQGLWFAGSAVAFSLESQGSSRVGLHNISLTEEL